MLSSLAGRGLFVLSRRKCSGRVLRQTEKGSTNPLMARIASAFKRLRKVNEAAVIPYVTVGLPSLDITRQLVPIIARQGADLIEIGPSPTDPAAGGVSTHPNSHVPLPGGISLSDCLAVA